MKRIFVLKLGSTFPDLAGRRGDFEDWVVQGMSLSGGEATVVDVPAGQALPGHDEPAGVVMTGAHEMVTERFAWSRQVKAWLPGLVEREVPTLGICYGHQLLAEALGGRAGDNPRGREIGSVTLTLTAHAAADPLFSLYETGPAVYVSHAQSALALPPGATLLASSAREPHHAFRLGKCVWGVQFHPEFDADITREYVQQFGDSLQREGQDPKKLQENCAVYSPGAEVLVRFRQFVETGLVD